MQKGVYDYGREMCGRVRRGWGREGGRRKGGRRIPPQIMAETGWRKANTQQIEAGMKPAKANAGYGEANAEAVKAEV